MEPQTSIICMMSALSIYYWVAVIFFSPILFYNNEH